MNQNDTTQALGQYPTPAWAAAALVRAHLADLTVRDRVLEPTCGEGRFLQAIPAHVPALGVEIDPGKAAEARRLTGRSIITGDVLTVALPERPTVIVGNPPFETRFIEQLLDRAHQLLVEGERVLLILPAYFFQTAARVVRYSEQWSMAQEMLPRNLYQGLKYPLVFSTFTRDQRRLMVGMSLYAELAYLQQLPKDVQQAMATGPATWVAVVQDALTLFGGEASLQDIYEYVAERRPTKNPHWREQVRKVCQTRTRRIARGRYASRPDQGSLFA